jgi:hypothetical protein
VISKKSAGSASGFFRAGSQVRVVCKRTPAAAVVAGASVHAPEIAEALVACSTISPFAVPPRRLRTLRILVRSDVPGASLRARCALPIGGDFGDGRACVDRACTLHECVVVSRRLRE